MRTLRFILFICTYIISIICATSAKAQINPAILKATDARQIMWSKDLTGSDTYWGYEPFLLYNILTDTLGMDASATNELQTLAIDSNATTYHLSISSGNEVLIAKGGGTPLTQEEVEDYAGAMVTGNTETLIDVTYQDIDGTIDYVVNDDLSLYDNTISGFLNTEVDGSTTNEIQTIDVFSFSDPTLSLSLLNDGEATKTVNLSALSDGNGVYDGSGSVGSGETQVTAGAGSFFVIDATGTAGTGTWGSFEVEINGSDAININAASNNVAIDGTTLVVETDTDLVGINHSSGSPPTQKLDVNGNVRLRADLYDSNNSSGSDSYVLSQDAGGITWVQSATPFGMYDTNGTLQTINTSGTGEKVINFAETYDPSAFYSFNGTTDVITPGEAGYYEISLGFESGGASSPSGPNVSICDSGGTPYKSFSLNPDATEEQWMEFTLVQYWASAPTVTIYASNGGSGSWTLNYAKVIIKRISK